MNFKFKENDRVRLIGLNSEFMKDILTLNNEGTVLDGKGFNTIGNYVQVHFDNDINLHIYEKNLELVSTPSSTVSQSKDRSKVQATSEPTITINKYSLFHTVDSLRQITDILELLTPNEIELVLWYINKGYGEKKEV